MVVDNREDTLTMTMTNVVHRSLGKKPATPGAVKLRLENYLDLSAVLPTIPASYGHEKLVTPDWGMLGNDSYGDCVFAGAAHESMLWTAEALGHQATFTDDAVLSDYSAVTGFNRNDPSTDQGTDMLAACKYRQRTGIVDADGQRHKLGAYLALTPGDVKQLHAAMYLFDGVGIGVEFPGEWMTAFNNGHSWTALRHPHIEGGHYITGVARHSGHSLIVSWGRLVALTDGAYHQFCDEAYAYLSPEKLRGGVDINGVDLAKLTADLHALTSL